LILKGGAQAPPFLYGVPKETENGRADRYRSVKKKEHEIFVGNPALTAMPIPPMCEAQKN
jgi:hypothetical protein